MKRIAVPTTLALLALGAVSGCSPKIDPKTWTCESLVSPVIDMSKSRDPKILEITNVSEIFPHDENQISCGGRAEWSDGSSGVKFGAHISDGNQVMLEYEHS